MLGNKPTGQRYKDDVIKIIWLQKTWTGAVNGVTFAQVGDKNIIMSIMLLQCSNKVILFYNFYRYAVGLVLGMP